MKTFLKQNWFKIALVIVIVIIIGGIFYWFQWRPTQIRKDCAAKNSGFKSIIGLPYEKAFQQCLNEKGLEK